MEPESQQAANDDSEGRLRTPDAIAAQIRVRERKLNMVDLCKHGFHFCTACQKITEDIGDYAPKCCWCGSRQIKFNPGVPDF